MKATRTCPDCATEVGAADLICFPCGANLHRIVSADEPPLPITVAQKAVRRQRAPPHLLDRTAYHVPGCNVEVPAGTSVLLGRDRLSPWWQRPLTSARTCQAACIDHGRRRRSRDDPGRALDERHLRQQRPAAAGNRRASCGRRHGPPSRRRHWSCDAPPVAANQGVPTSPAMNHGRYGSDWLPPRNTSTSEIAPASADPASAS